MPGVAQPDPQDVAAKLVHRPVGCLTPIERGHHKVAVLVVGVRVDAAHAGRQFVVDDA